MAAGNEWPRHNKTDDQKERTLDVWLHSQRITDRAGKLTPAKEKQLDKVIPGWRQGRQRRGANRQCCPEDDVRSRGDQWATLNHSSSGQAVNGRRPGGQAPPVPTPYTPHPGEREAPRS